MKNLITVMLPALIWTSCTVDTDPADQRITGTWEMMRTQNNMAGAPMDEDPDHEETYVFKKDGRFVKTRKEGESVQSAAGNYTVLPADPEAEDHISRLELRYEVADRLIYNCGSPLREDLVLTGEGILFNTWIACDRSYMEYEKKN